LHPAGIFSRGVAFLIDEFIRWTTALAVFMLASVAGDFGYGLALVGFFIVYWLYGVLFEVLNNGQTLGKKIQNLMVVHEDGTPIRLPASFLRNLLLIVDFFPVFYVAGIVSLMLAKFRRIGDLAAGTLVVYVHKNERSTEANITGARPLPFPMTPDEQLLLVEFLERDQYLSSSRKQELAEILQPILDIPQNQLVAELQKIANGIRGQ